MTYRSLAEIFAAKKAALQELDRLTGSLSAAQARLHPSNGGWSIAEILEHLSLVESQLLLLVTSLLRKAEARTRSDSSVPSYEISLEPHLERSRKEKFRTRENFVPIGNKKASDSLELLRSLENKFLDLRPRLELVDHTIARFPHWLFGPLSLGQWLAFIGLHEERHLAQIESIIASPEFKQLDNTTPS